MEYAIKIRNLNKHFMGVHAIDDFSFNIPYGITTAIIGSNGSGKSTLLNILTGQLRPDSGSIELKGERFRRIKPGLLRQFKITRTFQSIRLIEQLSVEDNLLLPVSEIDEWSSLFDVGCAEYEKKLQTILEITHLQAERFQLAGDLSYSQRRMLEIGRALMQNADIYFFDEPFAWLDSQSVTWLKTILQQLKQQEKTIILVDNNLNNLEELPDYVGIMKTGKLQSKGTPADISIESQKSC